MWFVLQNQLMVSYSSKDDYEKKLAPFKDLINLVPGTVIKPAPGARFHIETTANVVYTFVSVTIIRGFIVVGHKKSILTDFYVLLLSCRDVIITKCAQSGLQPFASVWELRAVGDPFPVSPGESISGRRDVET